MVLTSGLNREVAAGKGLEPAARESHTLIDKASSPECVFVSAGCVCRLAASEGGCNTLDPRFISQECMRVCLTEKKNKKINKIGKIKSQNSEKERRAREKEEEEKEEEEEGSAAKIRRLTYGREEIMVEKRGEGGFALHSELLLTLIDLKDREEERRIEGSEVKPGREEDEQGGGRG